MLADLLDGLEAVRADCRGDLPSGHRHARADGRPRILEAAPGRGDPGRHRLEQGFWNPLGAGKVLAQQVRVAQVTQQDRAHQPAVAQDQPAISPAPSVHRDDLLISSGRDRSAAAEQVDPRHLQRRRRDRSTERGGGPGERGGGDASLLSQRRPQAIDDPTVLRAFAHGVDPGRARAQLVVDHDRASHLESRVASEADLGGDPGGDHHHVGREVLTVTELNPRDRSRTEQRLRVGLQTHRDLQAVE